MCANIRPGQASCQRLIVYSTFVVDTTCVYGKMHVYLGSAGIMIPTCEKGCKISSGDTKNDAQEPQDGGQSIVLRCTDDPLTN